MSKDSDITVYGATSFVAKHILRYLLDVIASTEKEEGSMQITLAGRNKGRLEAVKKNFEPTHPKAFESIKDIVVADGSDLDSLKEMAKRTKVVINCVGPYSKYSSLVVAACAEMGTDYVDITGEAYWVAKMREKYGTLAKASGARIISLCGYDSIPSDLGVWAAVDALKQRCDGGAAVEVEDITLWHQCFGMPNGGTIHTALDFEYSLERDLFVPDDPSANEKEKSMLPTLRKAPFFSGDPLQLSHPTQVRYNPDYEDVKNSFALSEWINAFPCIDVNFGFGVSLMMLMAPINMKVLQASAVALKYGPKVQIRERFVPLGYRFTRMLGILSLLPVLAIQFTMWCSIALLLIPYVGKKVMDILMPPGRGAPDWMVNLGSNSVYVVVTRSKTKDQVDDDRDLVDRGYAHITFQGDAGNAVTAQCVCESALALVFNKDSLPERSEDGFGTPAQLLGPVLMKRFHETKVRPVSIVTSSRKGTLRSERQVYLEG